MALGPLTIPQPRRLLLPPTLLPRESTLSFTLEPTFMESVMLRPSQMPGVCTASPVSTPVLMDIPMAVSTTSTASVKLRLSQMPGESMATATQLSTLDTHMPTATSTASKELLSSGLNCSTFKNFLRRIIQLPDSWIPKKQVQNDYLLQTNSLVFLLEIHN